MTTTLTVGQMSDVGRVRKTNEDATCVLVSPRIRMGVDALLAVADGMGGHNAGQVASSTAVAFLCEHYSKTSGDELTGQTTSDSNNEAILLRNSIQQINNEIYSYSLSESELNGMGTTLVTALIVGDRLIVGHVGDSRAYLVSKNLIRQLTEDHSWVMEQVQAGLMKHEEAEVHPWRNVISRALGVLPDVSVDISSNRITINDTIILCSDGLSTMITEDEILQAVLSTQSPQTMSENLVNLANSRGGLDNITIVTARINNIL